MKYIRETALRDAIDLMDAVLDDKKSGKGIMGFLKNTSSKKSDFSGSISARSKDLIMTFPVLCSSTLDAKTATMISKAIERKCTTMLQMLFSSEAYTNCTSGSEVIKQFFNNVDMNTMNIDDVVYGLSKAKNVFGESDINMAIKLDLKAMNEESNITLPDSVSDNSIQEFKIIERYGKDTIVKEAGAKTAEEELQSELDKKIKELSKLKAADQKLKDGKTKGEIKKLSSEIFKNQLVDSDVKKANELVPSLMIINYRFTRDDNLIENSAVVGVKARLIPVDSYDIMERVIAKNKDKNGLIKFIRATTREISFCKDFIFAIDKAKVDSVSNSRKGSSNPMWKVLERRSLKQNLRKALKQSNDASPISSLVVTQEEVDYLKKTANVYLDNPKTAKAILESYNLLSLVIVDESLELAKFLFDGDLQVFETLSFSNLEREAGDGMYKKVINLMSKMR